MKETFRYQNGKLIRLFKNGKEREITTISRGYVVVSYKGKLHKAHRIIWQLFFGEIPDGMFIDHINHNKKDNRIENLRLVNHRTNHQNRSHHSEYGHNIQFHKPTGKYRVYAMTNLKQRHYGLYDTIEEAIEVRDEVLKTFKK